MVLVFGLLLFLGEADGLHFKKEAPPSMTFTDYMWKYGRTYQAGGDEYNKRLALFEARVSDFSAHNSKDGLFQMGINHLTDWTEEELAVLRGYKPSKQPSTAAGMPQLSRNWESVVEERGIGIKDLPDSFNWAGHLTSLKSIQDQGSCGSCWAVAATTVLRTYTELYSTYQELSAQQFVSCTPNPNQCGGKGGCQGATAELAYAYIMNASVFTESEFPYTASDEQCPQNSKKGLGHPTESLGMIGWEKLPENKLEPLLLALYLDGPVAVSIAADSSWSWYWSGIMDSCKAEAVVNHLVTLVGYGELLGNKYWLLQNSWGGYWGEKGYLRLLRRDHDKEAAYCGWDDKPEDGTGCTGGPSKVWVCGSCGILYDGVVPKFKVSKRGWWAAHGVPSEID